MSQTGRELLTKLLENFARVLTPCRRRRTLSRSNLPRLDLAQDRLRSGVRPEIVGQPIDEVLCRILELLRLKIS